MNEIVIDLAQFPEAIQEALKNRAVREGKPLKILLSELIAANAETILRTAGEADKPAA